MPFSRTAVVSFGMLLAPAYYTQVEPPAYPPARPQQAVAPFSESHGTPPRRLQITLPRWEKGLPFLEGTLFGCIMQKPKANQPGWGLSDKPKA